jgi:RND family efflux transporter MFP subunit
MSRKGLKKWQVAVLVIVVIGTAAGVYTVITRTSRTSNSSSSSLPANTQLVAVQSGNVVNSVSASGSVAFSNKQDLTFGIAGTVEQVNVQVGDTVKEGQILAKLDSASLISAQVTVAQATINLKNAQDNLAEVKLAEAQNTTQAELDVANAQIALTTAQDNLQKAQNADTSQAELDVANAQIALKTAQDNLTTANDTYQRNPSVPEWINDFELKKAQFAVAQDNLAAAQQALANMQASNLLQIAQSEKALAVAQANLTKAEQTLADIKAGQSSEEKLLQLQVKSAQAALDQAMKMGTVVAPSGGVVSSVNVVVGNTVTADTVAIVLVDPSVVEVDGILSEIDVAQVKQGQQASVSLDALPNVEIAGKLTSIAVIGKSTAGVVSYPVIIQLTPPQGVQLREGMSATATIVMQQANNVLVIPNGAIGGSVSNPTVSVMVNGQLEERAVTLGISDGTNTEVKAGLKEGDMVLVYTSSTSQPGFFRGGGGMMRIIGGD